MAAVEHCAALTRRDLFAFSPIVHWHVPALYYDLPKDFGYWEAYNLHMLSFCNRLDVLQLVGWKESIGVKAEIAFAQKHDIPIVYTLI